MALDRIVSMGLRAAELVFAAIVAGVTGDYLHHTNASSWNLGRFIYTEVVAGLSIFLALIWLIPFSSTFIHWPMDIFMSILWWVVFGLLVDLIGGSCGAIFDWGNVSPRGDQCGKFKADIAFAFLSAILWLVSALVGFFWVRKREQQAARADAAYSRRHRWYRRSHV
ncbi:integral membrane protein [Thelonectria olida]|uniref:Integral membrane protein n=1 Tax=Thelonectria olida TaxID=1576542 RepID=A0A9P8WK21_9HYPO|nr:integral membrane protein [Thelonectria olida]